MKRLEDNWTLEFLCINTIISLVFAYLMTPKYLTAFKECPEIFIDFYNTFGFELTYFSIFIMYFICQFIFFILLMALLALILGTITYLLMR